MRNSLFCWSALIRAVVGLCLMPSESNEPSDLGSHEKAVGDRWAISDID